ncbi:hypothetical protein GCM10027060_15680 [Nesterenkonia halophila]
MSQWTIRDFRLEDSDQLVEVWQESLADQPNPVYGLAEILDSCSNGVSAVAVAEGRVIGAAACQVQEDRAWVVLLAQAAGWRNRGLGSALLAAVEAKLAREGIKKISALLPASETRVTALRNSGYQVEGDLHYFEKTLPIQPKDLDTLTHLGGRRLPRGLWDSLAGMHYEKDLIDQRLILPLSRTELAESLGVRPPRSVILFGPPGTGKTTFAKSIASRLDWPFIEVFPSRLESHPEGLAGALRQVFSEIRELDHAVVFIDEVEEIASARTGSGYSPLQGVTNELLKIIPAFREQEGRILICATNFIRSLDKAFLRHGRFDYVIPIGPPDHGARRSIWNRYIPEEFSESIDLEALAEASERFSPADIEFAARRASQQALERAVEDSRGESAVDDAKLDTAAYRQAIGQTRVTITGAMIEEFAEDIDTIARV